MKTTKGGKVMNPTDAYRKEIRKKELKRNKKERKKVRDVGILKKDPETIKEQIEKLEMTKAEGALDKARKHKKRQLEDTLNLVLKKRKELQEKMKEKGEAPVMFSHLGPPRRRTSAEEEERVKHPKPEDSAYYHPTLNPTGAPPPGKPPMYLSSIGPRIPLPSSDAASSSQTESDDVALVVPPPPPPFPDTATVVSGDGSVIPASLPLPPPPPPPLPPNPDGINLAMSLPPPPLPPPPPGPPPKEQGAIHPPLPPPPPLQQTAQPPPPGISGGESERNQSAVQDDSTSKVSADLAQVSPMLPPPPPPPGMPHKQATNEFESASSEVDDNNLPHIKDLSKMVLPPPPPRQQPPVAGLAPIPTLHPDVLPPGISRFLPPPPPPDMRPPLSAPGLPGGGPHPGMMVPLAPRPPFGPPPGPPPMMRPPLPPGPPPTLQEAEFVANRPSLPQKPSYVKSAASTVVKRPLAQHTPELTAMVPASVRVRRENTLPKAKLKPALLTSATTVQPAAPTAVKPEALNTSVPKPQKAVNTSSAPKPQSIDDSYTAFLEDMKALGALDS